MNTGRNCLAIGFGLFLFSLLCIIAPDLLEIKEPVKVMEVTRHIKQSGYYGYYDESFSYKVPVYLKEILFLVFGIIGGFFILGGSMGKFASEKIKSINRISSALSGITILVLNFIIAYQIFLKDKDSGREVEGMLILIGILILLLICFLEMVITTYPTYTFIRVCTPILLFGAPTPAFLAQLTHQGDPKTYSALMALMVIGSFFMLILGLCNIVEDSKPARPNEIRPTNTPVIPAAPVQSSATSAAQAPQPAMSHERYMPKVPITPVTQVAPAPIPTPQTPATEPQSVEEEDEATLVVPEMPEIVVEAPAPEPKPEPAPTPEPEPIPAPTPKPEPTPAPEPAPTPIPEPSPAPAAPQEDTLAKIVRLAKLKEQGTLTQEEFELLKAKELQKLK